MNFYPFHIGDYLSHTSHLTDEEDLAYRRMIDLYYQTEEPFTDTSKLARKVRSSFEIVGSILSEFFVYQENAWHLKRADEEIAKYKAMKDGGRKGAALRWHKGSDSPPITPPNLPLMPTKNHEPITNNQDIKASSAESKIPPCPHQAIIDIYHQTLPELPKVISWNKTREAHLKQRWRELFTEFECKSSEEALDWFKNDFFQFIKNSKFLTGRTQSKDRRPFLADLEWVIKPTNFTKIIERKYL